MSQQQQNEVAKETSVSSLRLSRAPRPSFQKWFRHVRFVLWEWARKFSGVYFRIHVENVPTSGPLRPVPSATQTPTQRRMPDWIMTLAEGFAARPQNLPAREKPKSVLETEPFR